MKITKYDLDICLTCYRLKGTVEEEFNGVVPVFCMCDMSARRHSNHNPRMQGGVVGDGSVLLRFMPCSDYRRDDGEIWHVPHFAGFGWGCGRMEHLRALIDFIKQHNEFYDRQPEDYFIHFLEYNQPGRQGSTYLTSFYYKVKDKRIEVLSKCKNQYAFKILDFENQSGQKECLKKALIKYLADFADFTFNPVLVCSTLFTHEEFVNIISYSDETRDRYDERSFSSKKNIICICENFNLHPLPLETDDDIWVANCPSNAWHKIKIFSESQQWKCNHCQKSGGSFELFSWIKSVQH
jgi:hypothetical protein